MGTLWRERQKRRPKRGHSGRAAQKAQGSWRGRAWDAGFTHSTGEALAPGHRACPFRKMAVQTEQLKEAGEGQTQTLDQRVVRVQGRELPLIKDTHPGKTWGPIRSKSEHGRGAPAHSNTRLPNGDRKLHTVEFELVWKTAMPTTKPRSRRALITGHVTTLACSPGAAARVCDAGALACPPASQGRAAF